MIEDQQSLHKLCWRSMYSLAFIFGNTEAFSAKRI